MATEVHVYGVIAADDDATMPEATRRVTHDDLAAIVAEAESGTLPAARALREHWRVLEEVAQHTTVLPIRFGTVMTSDAAVVEDFLTPAHDGLRVGLESLAGKVQVSVKGTYDSEALLRGVVESSPRIARLREQIAALPEAAAYAKRIELGELVSAEVDHQRTRDAALVLERLEPLAVASRGEGASGLDGAVNAAFLVERAQLGTFEKAAAELADELKPRIAMRSIGPLPPYSFTPEGAAAWA